MMKKGHRTGRTVSWMIWSMALLLLTVPVHAQQATDIDLAEMSLEDLMSIEVTSVSKKEENIRGAAAAIFVITQEDIRRSGAASIPELLRLVPGLNVARLNANRWGVSSRGFNNVFANKLLVMIDGRTVYTSLFAGTFWDTQVVVIEDIERIEVIRGPGGSLWGANAVNGIINVITKSAKDTLGGLLTVGGGTEEKAFTTLRYGKKFSDRSYGRFFAKFFDRDGGELASGADAKDDNSDLQIGFRFDWDPAQGDRITFQGDIQDASYVQPYSLALLFPPYAIPFNSHGDVDAANLLLRWSHELSDTSDIQLQFYYDITDRVDITFDERRQNFDLDFQHHLTLGKRHEIVWGAGYRLTTDTLKNTFWVAFNPEEEDSNLYSMFIQDDITLIEDRLRLSIGSKFEHNDYSGFEAQPSIRIAWTPTDRHTLWSAVTRAVRTPSRAEHDIKLTASVFPGGIAISNIGRDSFDSENVIAYEFGYRIFITENLSIDAAFFYNDYDHLRTIEITAPFIVLRPIPHLVIPGRPGNNMDARTYGAEIVLDWRPTGWVKLRATYTYLNVDLSLNPIFLDIVSGDEEGSSPQQQFRLDTHFNLPRDVEFDVMLQYVDRLPTFNVDDYVDLDLRVAWQPKENLTLEFVAQNLLERRRLEFSPTFVNFVPSQNERGFYGKLTWRF